MIDSPHLRDINGACHGCGAKWILEEPDHQAFTLTHTTDCPQDNDQTEEALDEGL